jgi:hypothetical protein
MSRTVFVITFGLVFVCLATAFYGQEQDLPAVQLPVPEGVPADAKDDAKADPLLEEMTELFLKDKSTNRKLEFPKDGAVKSDHKSSAVYHAAELLLKAARILEADVAKSGVEDSQTTERVVQLRALAVEILTQ